MSFKITATAPTVYQTSSLRAFNIGCEKVGNGSYHGEQLFDTEEQAKQFLRQRALLYYDQFEGQADDYLAIIDRSLCLEIDAVTAFIREVYESEEE